MFLEGSKRLVLCEIAWPAKDESINPMPTNGQKTACHVDYLHRGCREVPPGAPLDGLNPSQAVQCALKDSWPRFVTKRSALQEGA